MKTPNYTVWQITETDRIDEKTREPISYWNKIGAAWINKDGSINVQLNCLPIDGKLHLRKPKVKEANQDQA